MHEGTSPRAVGLFSGGAGKLPRGLRSGQPRAAAGGTPALTLANVVVGKEQNNDDDGGGEFGGAFGQR